MKSHSERIAEIRAMAPTRDWRYFSFYMGVVQTLGSSNAGESIRRAAAAKDAAEAETTETAAAVRDTYMDLVLPNFEDRGSEVDVARAVLHIDQALVRCPVLR